MCGHAVDDCVGVDVEVLAAAAPQRGCRADRRGAVAQGSAAVGLIAEAEGVGATPLAGAAGQILFERDAVAFGQPPARCRSPADARDDADVLVPEDFRAARQLQGALNVAAADATSLDLEHGRVVADFGQVFLSQLGLLRGDKDGQPSIALASWQSTSPALPCAPLSFVRLRGEGLMTTRR